MKLKVIGLGFGLLMASAMPAFAADSQTTTTQPNAQTNTQTNSTTANTQAPATQDNSKNAEIIAWVMTVDKSEIAAAKIVLKKKISEPVKKFAQMMISQHGKNLMRAKQLSHHMKVKPVEGSDAKSLKEDSEKEGKKLEGMTDGVDKEYMNAMVDGHTAALKQVDDYLQAGDQNPKMQKFLKDTKEMISHHLDEAKKVQGNLKD